MRGTGGSTAARQSSAHVVDQHLRAIPAEPLRRYVAAYTGYRQRGVPPARHRGLPSPYLTLIFTLDEPLTIAAHPDPGQPPGEFGTLLGGLHSVPALITHAGAQSGIQVALRPLGARALLGLPAGELAELDVPADAVLGGVMLGSVRAGDTDAHGQATPTQPGTFGAYVVTDDVDAVYRRATAVGAEIIAEPHDTDYGSHDFAARDPEGNRWSFGTYRGEPRKAP
jgi:uncharacterized glyoxalase superfamily protein PhnB